MCKQISYDYSRDEINKTQTKQRQSNQCCLGHFGNSNINSVRRQAYVIRRTHERERHGRVHTQRHSLPARTLHMHSRSNRQCTRKDSETMMSYKITSRHTRTNYSLFTQSFRCMHVHQVTTTYFTVYQQTLDTK